MQQEAKMNLSKLRFVQHKMKTRTRKKEGESVIIMFQKKCCVEKYNEEEGGRHILITEKVPDRNEEWEKY